MTNTELTVQPRIVSQSTLPRAMTVLQSHDASTGVRQHAHDIPINRGNSQ
jgi:hypothetical protein